MTRDEALNNSDFHYGNCTRSTGPRGGVKEHVIAVRRTGQNKTWKTRPEDFRVPVKHGMYDSGEIVPSNLAEFHLPAQCPLLDGADHKKDEQHVGRVQSVTVPILNNMVFYRPICTCGYKEPEMQSYWDANDKLVAHLAAQRDKEPVHADAG